MRFASLNTAVSGMNAAQANLYVTGHNMANVHIGGFTRQQVIQADWISQGVGRNHSGLMQVGLGADVQSIRQIRNTFLDIAFRESNARMSFYSVSFNVGQVVESTIGETEGEFKLQSVLRDLKNHISELHNDMTGVDTRGEFLASAGSFVDKAFDVYRNLRMQQENLNDNIIAMTRRINFLIGEINTYSQLIQLNEVAGDNANDFRDIVNRHLDELSGYLQIDYRIGPGFNVTIFSEGKVLLSNRHQNMLGLRVCDPNSNFVEVVMSRYEGIHKYTDDVPLFFNYRRNIDPRFGNDGGALKGLLAARGMSTATFIDSEQQIRDRHAAHMIHLEAWTAPGVVNPNRPTYPDPRAEEIRLAELQFRRDIFSVNNSIIFRAQLQLDTLVNQVVRLVNNHLAPKVPRDPPNIVFQNHGGVPDGFPAGFNSGPNWDPRDFPPDTVWVPGMFANNVSNPWHEAYNEDHDDYFPPNDPRRIINPFGQDLSQGFVPIFVRRGEDWRANADGHMPNMQGFLGEITQFDPSRTRHDVMGSLFTIGNFIINPIFSQPSGYKYMTLSRSGDAEDLRALADLIEAWDSRLVAIDDDPPLSIEEFYRRIVVGLGIDIAEFRRVAESEAEILNKTENARLSMSGVALDEEMANMLRFQHAFAGAARLFNYIDSMLDRIINGTGRVGL